MKKKFSFKKLLWLLIPLASYILYEIAYRFPYQVEKYYSRGIYPFISKILSKITGYLPFSVAEFLLIGFALYVLYTLIALIVGLFSVKEKKMSVFFGRLENFAILCGFLYSFFVLFWSLNFSRIPLIYTLGYEKSLYSVEELDEVTRKLAVRARELREKVSEDENGCFKLSAEPGEYLKKVSDIYKNSSPEFIHLGAKANVKKNSIKNLLSVYNIQGIYSPFTFEPNVNGDIPPLYYPASACHEYAHLQGFCREDEAEFLCFYVCRNCGDNDFMYSATVTALTHALSALKYADYERYIYACGLLSEGIYRDFAQHDEYWKPFEGKIEEVSETINDNYLISNHQESGIKSYGEMLDIILAMNKAGDL